MSDFPIRDVNGQVRLFPMELSVDQVLAIFDSVGVRARCDIQGELVLEDKPRE